MKNHFAFLAVTALVISTRAQSIDVGVWHNAPTNIQVIRADRQFAPDFFLVKLGAFGVSGAIKAQHTFASMLETCGKGAKTRAWITHKIGPKDDFKDEKGTALGKSINQFLGSTCYESVELNIEKMPSPPSWLNGYLQNVRKALGREFNLSITSPPIYSAKILGLHWTADQAKSVLSVVDGLDIMLYDTGTDKTEYEKIWIENLAFANSVAKEFSGKKVLIGIPAYKSYHQFHLKEAENTENVLGILKALPPGKYSGICENTEFSIYSSWVMDDSDKKYAREIKKWFSTYCEKKADKKK